MPQESLGGKLGIKLPQIRSQSLVALGSNQISTVGEPDQTLKTAVERLAEMGVVIRAQSRIFRTPAFPLGSGPDFANAAIEVEHAGDAQSLLTLLHRIEEDLGRTRRDRWGPRTLDLDLLATGDAILPDAATQTRWRNLPPELQGQTAPRELVLPHPRLQDRAFVLIPLAEIAPDWVHPLLGLTVWQMLDALPGYLLQDVVPYG